jgi:hypothetical protein
MFCYSSAGIRSRSALDHTHSIQSHPKFFLAVEVLAKIFRGKFTEAIKEILLKPNSDSTAP